MDHISRLGPMPWPPGVAPPPVDTLPALVEWHARTRPHAPAIVAGEDRLDYRRLAEEIRGTSAALARLGVGRGSHVALLASNTAEWLVVAFAVMRLGAVLESFNTWVKEYDLDHLLSSSQAEVLVMVPGVRKTDLLSVLKQLAPDLWTVGRASRFPALRNVVVLPGQTQETSPPLGAVGWNDLDRSGPFPPIAATATDTAYVLYTSGTTSQPKAVPLAHRPLIENGFAIGARMGLHQDDRVWLGSPLFWSYGCANAAMATFGHGACLVLQERFTATDAAQLMAAEQVTAAYLLPSIAGALAVERRDVVRALTSLRTGLAIGNPEEVQTAAVDLDIPELCNVYGSTETYGNCCVTDHRMALGQRLMCQGEPLPGNELRVVGDDEQPVPLGVPGEIQVRGRVMSGYVGNPEATADAITDDGWFRTGDTGIIRPDGTVQFASRATDMIKTSGINVSPAEVEGFLSGHEAVLEVGVVGAPHPAKGEVTVAFVVVKPGKSTSDEELIDYCKRSLSGFKVPWAVELVGELPRTTTGKMMRRDLRDPAAALVSARLAQRGENL